MPRAHKIRVEFIDKNNPVEPPNSKEITDAIRKELESLHPVWGDVVLWHANNAGWAPLEGMCWVHGVQDGMGVTSAKNVEPHVRVVLSHLGMLTKP
jgi:hypothetical protein